MLKAKFTLPNGTIVDLEGTPADVKDLLSHYSAASPGSIPKARAKSAKGRAQKNAAPSEGDGPNVAAIVSQAKDCDDAASIEKNILDQPSRVNRTLLPLFVIHEHFGNKVGLTSGEIHKVTHELGVPVGVSNASNTLAGAASRYVIADKVRRPGQPTRYTLSRRGLTYIKAVIAGTRDEDEA